MNPPRLLLVVSATLFGLSVAAAQTPAPAPPPFAVPPYKNLKVLPADIARQELIGTMRSFSLSLGVRCTHCHAAPEGTPLPQIDFASDANPNKEVARAMMRMVAHINREGLPAAGLQDAEVTCYSCHGGKTRPATVPPEPPKA